MEIPTKRVKEGVSCCALLSLESLLKKLQSNPYSAYPFGNEISDDFQRPHRHGVHTKGESCRVPSFRKERGGCRHVTDLLQLQDRLHEQTYLTSRQ